MKRVLLVVLLLFSLLSITIMLSHIYPEKVPKSIATAFPETYYKKIPRQIREYFPWIKPKGYVKPFSFTKEDIAALNLQDEPEETTNTNGNT